MSDLGSIPAQMAAEYRLAMFSLVEPHGDWKMPIDALVMRDTPAMRAALLDAVEFFTASTPTFSNTCGALRVQAVGYYNATQK